MTLIPLSFVERRPVKKRTRWHVFEPSDQFVEPWWESQYSVHDFEHWISAYRESHEVARCKFVFDVRPQSHPLLGEMPHGQLDILALEVAVRDRGRGTGREVVRTIRRMYPLPLLTALNDTDESRGFWDSMGWARREHPHPLFRSERVTYSEG